MSFLPPCIPSPPPPSPFHARTNTHTSTFGERCSFRISLSPPLLPPPTHEIVIAFFSVGAEGWLGFFHHLCIRMFLFWVSKSVCSHAYLEDIEVKTCNFFFFKTAFCHFARNLSNKTLVHTFFFGRDSSSNILPSFLPS